MARTEAGLVLLAVLLVAVSGFQISDTETQPMPRGLFGKLIGAVHKVVHEAEHNVAGAVHKVTHEAKDKVTGAVHKVTGAVHKVTHEAEDKVSGTVHKVTHEAKDKVTGAVHKVTGTVHKVTHEAEEKVTEVVDKVAEKLKAEAEHLLKLFKGMNLCSCSSLQCSCCAKLSNSSAHAGACFMVKFMPQEMDVHYELTLGGKKLLSGDANPNKLTPICVPIPYVPGLTVCLQPYDLSASHGFHGCFRVKINFMKISVPLDLSCIDINKGMITIEPQGPLKKIPDIKIPLTKH